MATKKSRSGIVRPDAGLTPLVFVRAAATRTLYFPRESTNRYGFSRLTGVVASVV